MRKQEFLDALKQNLSGLSASEITERVSFYQEMIEDRMEEGIPEEEAVREIGSVDAIASSIRAQLPPITQTIGKAPKKKKPKKGRRTWEIVLLAVGSPLWLALLIAAFAVLLSLYVSLWAVVIAVWASFGTLVGSAFGGLVVGLFCLFSGNGYLAAAMIGAACVCAGLAIFTFIGSKEATRGSALLAPVILRGIKRIFANKEGA